MGPEDRESTTGVEEPTVPKTLAEIEEARIRSENQARRGLDSFREKRPGVVKRAEGASKILPSAEELEEQKKKGAGEESNI